VPIPLLAPASPLAADLGEIIFCRPMAFQAWKSRFDQQPRSTAMLIAVIILALLTVLVGTEADPGDGEGQPPAADISAPAE
jgi:hypothetical protein